MFASSGLRRFAKGATKFRFSTARQSASGIEIVSPLIGLTNDQTEYYNLARQFADNEMRPNAGLQYPD